MAHGGAFTLGSMPYAYFSTPPHGSGTQDFIFSSIRFTSWGMEPFMVFAR